MTTFYSMSKLLKLSGGKVEIILKLLKENKSNIRGDSYLLHLDKLLDARATNLHKVEYVYLASFRCYADYTLLEIDYLDLSLIPDIDVTKINRLNPLISIENKIIKFKKE